MVDFSEFATGIAICAGHLGLDEMIKCALCRGVLKMHHFEAIYPPFQSLKD